MNPAEASAAQRRVGLCSGHMPWLLRLARISLGLPVMASYLSPAPMRVRWFRLLSDLSP